MPTFWSRRDGELKAGLVFRVGHADEQLARRGITHLVDRMELENQVLLTEASRAAGQDVGSALAIWRYGAAAREHADA